MLRLLLKHYTAALALATLAFLYASSVFIRDYAIVPRLPLSDVEDVVLPASPHSKISASSKHRPHHASSLPKECDYCGPTDTLCKVYGEHNLARSRAYEGTNIRLRRVIAKARSGKPITVSVLGGSVSKGHGVNHKDNWTTRFFEFWNATFPHPENKFINGAVAAVTSDYYMACALEHIDKNSDLILLEMAINDGTQQFYTNAFEWLVRRLLVLPNHPAVLNAQILAFSFGNIATGGENHIGLAEYYDIPTISLKNVVARHIMRDFALVQEMFGRMPDNTEIDMRHISKQGHRMLADLLQAYIRRQICEQFRYKSLYDSVDPSGPMSHLLPLSSTIEELPRQRLWSKYNQNETVPDINPTCMSMNNKKNRLKPLSNSGWVEWSWKDKSYIIAKKPGDKITFEVKIDAMGTVSLSYQKSKTYGFGRVKCWLNDDLSRSKVISGYWDIDNMNTVRTETIVHNAPRGKHLLHCEIIKETDDPKGRHEFRIVALTST